VRKGPTKGRSGIEEAQGEVEVMSESPNNVVHINGRIEGEPAKFFVSYVHEDW